MTDSITQLHERTLMALLDCCEAWEPDVRVLGNVRAVDAADAIRFYLAAPLAVEDSRERPKLSAVVATLMAALAKARPQQETPEGWSEYEYAMNLARFVLSGADLTESMVDAAHALDPCTPREDVRAMLAAALGQDSRERCASSDAKDAARYRWFREAVNCAGGPVVAMDGGRCPGPRELFDAAVDAAMAAASSGDTKIAGRDGASDGIQEASCSSESAPCRAASSPLPSPSQTDQSALPRRSE